MNLITVGDNISFSSYEFVKSVEDDQFAKRQIFQNVLYTLITAFGTISNVFVIAVIITWERNKSNKNVTQLFALNLAFADILFILSLPLYSLQIQNGSVGDALCKFKRTMDHLNYHASILFLTVMSLDRLLATVYLMRMRVYRTRRNAWYACVIVWLLALATSSPYGYYAKTSSSKLGLSCQLSFPVPETNISKALASFEDIPVEESEEKILDVLYNFYDINKTLEEASNASEGIELADCENIKHKTSLLYRRYLIFKFIFFYVIPIIAIIGSYSIILLTATRRLSKMPLNQKKMRKHMVVTIACMVIAFIVCWSPLLVWNLVTTFSSIQQTSIGNCQWIETIFEVLAFSNSALTPVFYWLTSHSFRQKIFASYRYLKNGRKLNFLVLIKREDSNSKFTRSFRDFSKSNREGQVLISMENRKDTNETIETTMQTSNSTTEKLITSEKV